MCEHRENALGPGHPRWEGRVPSDLGTPPHPPTFHKSSHCLLVSSLFLHRSESIWGGTFRELSGVPFAEAGQPVPGRKALCSRELGSCRWPYQDRNSLGRVWPKEWAKAAPADAIGAPGAHPWCGGVRSWRTHGQGCGHDVHQVTVCFSHYLGRNLGLSLRKEMTLT